MDIRSPGGRVTSSRLTLIDDYRKKRLLIGFCSVLMITGLIDLKRAGVLQAEVSLTRSAEQQEE